MDIKDLKITNCRVTSLNIDMPNNMKPNVGVKFDCVHKLVHQDDETKKKVLLIMEQRIFTPDSNILSIELDSDTEAEVYNQEASDEEIEKALLAAAQNITHQKLNAILINMGIGPMFMQPQRMPAIPKDPAAVEAMKAQIMQNPKMTDQAKAQAIQMIEAMQKAQAAHEAKKAQAVAQADENAQATAQTGENSQETSAN